MTEKKEVQGIQQLDHFPLNCNHQTISHQPGKFIFDFKGIYPQFTPDNKPQMVITHKSILMNPYTAKEFSKILSENVKKYEKEHGKITEPDYLKKAKKKNKADKKKSIKAEGTNPDRSYIG